MSACWADPLNSSQRNTLAKKLARAARAFHSAAAVSGKGRGTRERLLCAVTEMQDLHLDVTERAEVPVP